MSGHASTMPAALERGLAAAMRIPSPPVSGFHVGPLSVHVYGLMYVIGISLAVLIARRRWQAQGGDPALVGDVAIWAVPAGIVGGRIYFDLTTPKYIPHHWYGIIAVWDGGLGIWGGVALAAVVGLWRVRRAGANAPVFMDAVAPALLAAQAIGRIGNYFNQELFGGPTGLPWGLYISPAHRPPATAATPPSSPPSCTSWSSTPCSRQPLSGWGTTGRSGRQACSRST